MGLLQWWFTSDHTDNYSQPSEVVVDLDAGINTPPTQYTTIREAMLSFDENRYGTGIGGINSGDAAVANIISVSGFGPYDEVIPVIGDQVWDGITDGAEGLTIQQASGSTDTPLVLAQDTGLSGSSWIVTDVTDCPTLMKGFITAQSSTAVGNDDFIFVIGNSTVLNMEDMVVTALPADATAYTSVADITPELLDGTAPFDASLIRSGDNGVYVGWGSATVPMVLNATNTVITQQGAGSSPDGIVMYIYGDVNLYEGCVLANNSRLGIQMASNIGCNAKLDGTLDNPVIVAGHTSSDGIRPYGAGGYLVVDNAIFDNNVNGISIWSGALLNPFTVTNSIFSNNSNIGLDLGNAPAGLSVSQCTFYANGTGMKDDIGEPGVQTVVSVTDCIFAGAGTGADIKNGAPNVTFYNCAFAAVGGPDVLSATLANGALVTFIPAPIDQDPIFESTTFSSNRQAPDWFLAVNNDPWYSTAAYSGGYLSGGGVQGPTNVNDWDLY